MARSRNKLDDDRLVAERIDPEWERYGGRADARTREGVPVWALVAQLRATGDDPEQLARDYGLPRETVEACQ